MITYTPNPESPINLDLSSYSRPEADRGTVKFAWMYAVFGAVCVILLILKPYIAFVQSYFVLLEVMAAILLFMAGKCYFAYAREYSRFLRWDCTAARIKKITEHESNGHTFIEMEFTPEGENESIQFTEEINALPLLYRPSACRTRNAFYVDLRFNAAGLDTSNLMKKK